MNEEFIVDFPALFITLDWTQRHCVVPDGELKGEPLILTDWQAWCMLKHYQVKPDAAPNQKAPAFAHRRSQIVMPQKTGKSVLAPAFVCLEGVGPALFAGWAESGDTFRCSDHGCPCGWVYHYEEGEAKGKPWATPLIQLTAVSEDQVSNMMDALRPMINEGPLTDVIPRVTEDFIRLPNDGRIDAVSSNARSRLGQRVTFVVMDETGLWLPTTAMAKVAATQRRGLAGMSGRALETTNAYDPGENSIAQQTAEASAEDLFRYHPKAPSKLSYTNKRDRRKIHEHVYAGCPWVDLDAIEAEATEILEFDPAQAQRFYGNIITSGGGQAYNIGIWDSQAHEMMVKRNSLIVIGIDGAKYEDALAMIATEVSTGFQWPLGIWEVPSYADEDYAHDFDEVDGVMQETFKEYRVWRAYIDPQRIEQLLERWQGRWGDKTILPWYTNRPKAMAHAVRKHVEAVNSGDLTHDGDKTFRQHIANAVKQSVNVYDDDHRKMFVVRKDRPHSPKKMDGAVASIISWEARGDCIAAGQLQPRKSKSLIVL